MSWLSAELRRVVDKSAGEGSAAKFEETWDENPVASNMRDVTIPKSGTKKFLKYWEKTAQWWSHHTLGSDYPGKDRRGNTSTDDIKEPGTKATMAGKGGIPEEESGPGRRFLASRTGVNVNPGKTAKSLIRQKGKR